MYSSHSIWLIIIGIILLLAMVGTITIVLNQKKGSNDKLAKGLSKQTFIKSNTANQCRRYSTKTTYTVELNPFYISGFVDGEGCFIVNITIDPKRTLGVRIIPSFLIKLDRRDTALIYRIKKYFKVGSIRISGSFVVYSVSSLKDLINVIIPHFDMYPLITKKKSRFPFI